MRESSDRVEPSAAPGIAAQQSPPGEQRAPQQAFLPYRVDRVLRAGRVVLARGRKERTERDAIEPDGRDPEPIHQAAAFVMPRTSSTRSPSHSNPSAATASGKPGRTINT